MNVVRARLYGLMLLGFLAAPPAAALQPGSAAVAPGEISLQVSARGIANSPPDLITINASVTSYGETVEAARSANEAAVARLIKALASKGIESISRAAPVPAIAPPPPPAPVLALPRAERTNSPAAGSFAPPPVGSSAPPPVVRQAPPPMTAPAVRRNASTTLQLKLSSRAQLESARQVIEAHNAFSGGTPRYGLKDDSAARRVAIADAIARARAEAEVYASSLVMRIVRIAKVTNQAPLNDPYSAAATLLAGQADAAPNVVTSVGVTIEFVMAPR